MAHNHRNLEEALLTRVFYEKIDGVWQNLRRPTVDIGKRLHDFEVALLAGSSRRVPLSAEAFLAQANPEKRELYAQAQDSLLHKSLSTRDLRRKAFTKVEKYLKPSANPRVIQAASERAHVAWGRYVQSIEKKLYRMINRLFGYEVIMKGKNMDQMGCAIHESWTSVPNPVGILLDASRFDQHVSAGAQRWKHRIYLHLLRLTPSEKKEFLLLASSQISSRVDGRVEDGKFIYQLEGSLASGDMDTSLTACLLVCGMFYTFLHDRVPAGHWRFIDNGDDCVVIIDEKYYPVMEELPCWMEEMGFQYRIDGIAKSVHEIRFCQVFPIYDEVRSTWTCCRDPVAALKKDIMSSHSNNVAGWADNFHSIAVGGLALFGGMPILGAFYEALLAQFPEGNFNKKYLSWNLRNLETLEKRRYKPTQQMRLEFYIATGVPPAAQEELEEVYATRVPSKLSFTNLVSNGGLYSFTPWLQ